MHILFLTHYYPPESNAPANRVAALAKAWVAAGNEVTVVTCTPNHPGGRPFPGYRNPGFFKETMNGVTVLRLGTFLAPNEGVGRRGLNFVSYLFAVAANLHRLPRADVVISTSPQFFAGLAGAVVSRVQRRPWILEIRDIWPESISTVGAMKRGLVLRMLEWLERWAYRSATQVVVVSRAFIPHIQERGKVRRPVKVIENGADLDLFGEPRDGTAFRRRQGLEGKVVFGYVGTHGMAHGLHCLLNAAELTRNDPQIAYLLVGGGAERNRLVELHRELKLDNVVMLDHLPRRHLPEVWAAIDVSVILLRRSALFRRVIPSKMFEAMALARPIIVGVDGEARSIIEQGDCGVFFEPEDVTALVRTVRQLAEDTELRHRLGENGRRFVRRHYDRKTLAARYLEIIASVAAEHPAQPAKSSD